MTWLMFVTLPLGALASSQSSDKGFVDRFRKVLQDLSKIRSALMTLFDDPSFRLNRSLTSHKESLIVGYANLWEWPDSNITYL